MCVGVYCAAIVTGQCTEQPLFNLEFRVQEKALTDPYGLLLK